MFNNKTGYRSLVLAFAGALLMSLHAFADAPRRVDIPAGDLKKALDLVSKQYGAELIYRPEHLSGLKTHGVKGELTAEEAVSKLLEGTKLKVSTAASGAMLISGATAVSITSTEPGGAAHMAQARPVDMQKVDEQKMPAGGVAIEQGAGDGEILVRSTRDTGIVNQGVIPRAENEAVRYEIIDRAAIERSGATSLSDLLIRGVPQSANYGTGTHQELGKQSVESIGFGIGFGFGTTQDQVNLRGLGSAQTLVLVNGRRLYGNSDDGGPDVSRIPLSMVERIEVMPSSGSAIYGANAMGGVINIILRKDYAGRQYTAYFGTADGGAEEYRLSGVQGFNLNDGRTNVSVNFELSKIEPLLMRERRYYQRMLDRIPPTSPNYANQVLSNLIGPLGTVVGGTFSPAPLGIPANPTATFAGVPSGSSGTGLTLASFNATAGIANVSTSRVDETRLSSGSETAALFTTIEHALSDRLSAFSELSFRWTDNSVGSLSNAPSNLWLPAANGFNPFGQTVTVRLDPVDVPRTRQSSKQKTYRAVAGLRGVMDLFGDREYKWSADVSWDRNEAQSTTRSYTRFLRDMVNAGVYNPLRDLTNAPLLPANELRRMQATNNLERRPVITATNWRANGDLFEAWGGTAGISVGAEYRHQSQFSSTQFDEFDQGVPVAGYEDSYVLLTLPFLRPLLFAEQAVESTRDTYAGYTEVNVPLVGERNRMPLVYSLDLSAAMRYEKYDDFSAAKPPMAAVKWALSRDLALRAQFSEGFQPPTASDLSDPVSISVGDEFTDLTDPLRPGQPFPAAVDTLYGGNPDLRPETSDTWDAGIILTPRWIPGLTINASYFEYDKKDLVNYLSLQEAINAGFVTRGPDAGGLPGPITQIDQRIVNVAHQFLNGWDLKAVYAFGTGGGDFTLTAQATHSRKFQRQVLLTDPRINTVGDLAPTSEAPLKWAGLASLQWQRGGWGAGWTSRYTDSFLTTSTSAQPYDAALSVFRTGLDGASIPSRVEHDVQLRYRFGQAAGALGDFLSGTEWQLGANNVFNKEPELITDSGSQWHSFYADPRQRFIYFQLKKSF